MLNGTESIQEPVVMNERQAAELVGLSLSTLRRFRRQQVGPRFLKLTDSVKGPVRYRRSDLLAWLEDCARGGGEAA